MDRAPREGSPGRSDGGGAPPPLADDRNRIRDRYGNSRDTTDAPALGHAQARGKDSETDDNWKCELADHAFEPESALNARRSLSGATSTSISSPFAKSPTRIFSDSGSSTYF